MEFVYQQNRFDNSAIHNPVIKEVFAFLKTHDITKDELGRHEVNENMFYSIIELTTSAPEELGFESHRQFYDVHIILEGSERIGYNHINDMTLVNYDEKNDFQMLTGDTLFDIICPKGSVLFLDENDAHKPGMFVQAPEKIKKAVFKVAVRQS